MLCKVLSDQTALGLPNIVVILPLLSIIIGDEAGETCEDQFIGNYDNLPI